MEVSITKCSCSVFLVIVFINLVNGLKCFECTLSEPGCANPNMYKNISLVDCSRSIFTINPDTLKTRHQRDKSDEDYQCLVTIEKNSTHRLYTRRCALKSEQTICDLSTKNNNGFEFEKCSLCDKDYCNSSNVLKFNVIYSYLLLLVLVFLYK